jgi:hypothetical protein
VVSPGGRGRVAVLAVEVGQLVQVEAQAPVVGRPQAAVLVQVVAGVRVVEVGQLVQAEAQAAVLVQVVAGVRVVEVGQPQAVVLPQIVLGVRVVVGRLVQVEALPQAALGLPQAAAGVQAPEVGLVVAQLLAALRQLEAEQLAVAALHNHPSHSHQQDRRCAKWGLSWFPLCQKPTPSTTLRLRKTNPMKRRIQIAQAT